VPSTLHSPSSRIRSVSLLLAGTLAVSSVVIASPAIGQAPPAPVPFEDIYSPTGSPDRVVMTPTADPATSQAVTWRTSTDVETPVAEIVPIEAGPGFKNYDGRSGRNEVTQVAGAIAGDVSESLHYPMRFHTATFEGLEPDTTYLYRVGDGSTGNRSNRSNWSEWFEFTTATAGASDFSFIYVGDAQNAVKEHVSRVFRRAFQDRPDAELFLSAGDLVDVADRDYEWGEWFHANQVTTGNINQLATPGNHEYFREGLPNNVLNAYWDVQFDYPDNGPKAPDGVSGVDAEVYERLDRGNVHYVDYQGVRFISLDSGLAYNGYRAGEQRTRALEIQAEWLDEVLTDNPNQWTVVYHHHPIFSVSTRRNNTELRNVWLPIIEKHEVDLVLAGHDHTYGRGHLNNARRGNSTQVHNGTVFAVSVSGPKMYNVSGVVWEDNDAFLASTAQDTQLYQLIDVSLGELRYEARDATGAFHDGFQIRKQPNGNRTVTELRP
jgi:hypothetical protein